MKKFFLLAMLTGTVALVNAQVKVPAAKSATEKSLITPPAIGDLDQISTTITNSLGTKLSLDKEQKDGTFAAVKGFLEEKKTILDLAKTNKASYQSKFGTMQAGLFSTLKTVLGNEKFASFLKLKPATSNDVLSNLFY